MFIFAKTGITPVALMVYVIAYLPSRKKGSTNIIHTGAFLFSRLIMLDHVTIGFTYGYSHSPPQGATLCTEINLLKIRFITIPNIMEIVGVKCYPVY